MIENTEAEEFADWYNDNLRSTDPRFNYCVTVIELCGTTMHFENAFCVSFDDFYIVFGERHRPAIFFQEDAKVIQHGPIIPIEKGVK